MLKKTLITSAVALGLLMGSLPAHADVTVNPGTLDFDPAGAPAIGNFTAVTLNGTPQLTSLVVDPFTIIDATGSGAGWHVLLTVPDFTNPGVGANIPASQVSMTAPVVTATAGSLITNVQGNTSAGNFNTGEKIVTADVGYGMGTYLVSPRILKLTVPANASVGTYTSTATIAVVSGP